MISKEEEFQPTPSSRRVTFRKPPLFRMPLFQPTPSSRRVTGYIRSWQGWPTISTNTLLAEGDATFFPFLLSSENISTNTLLAEGDTISELFWR